MSAIVFNYFIASSFGLLQMEDHNRLLHVSSDWWLLAISISFLFISLFYLMAKTAQEMGVSVSSNASKMSMLIPLVLLAVMNPSERLSGLQIIGILIALLGIYFTSLKGGKGKGKMALFWPFLLFIGTGSLDYLLAIANQELLQNASDDNLFTSLTFGLAFLWGLVYLIYLKIKDQYIFTPKVIIAGGILGIINYGSIFFLLRTYGSNIAQKTVVLPINNMGVIIVSTLFSILLFREKLSAKNFLGLALSLFSIFLIFYQAI
jgi:drug/metabolite transporter (DMT)-like permease